MASIGEKLRQERRRQNLELADVAGQTKIRLNFLAAIEAEAWDQLPGRFFARSFVQQYGRALGMGGGEIDAEVEKLFKVQQTASDVETSSRPQRIHLAPLPARISQPGFRERHWLAHLGFLAAVAMFSYGTYTLWESGRQASRPAARPATATSPVVTAPAVPAAPEDHIGNSSSPPAIQQGSPTENSPAAQVADRLTVNLVASEETWVSAKVEGQEVFSGVLKPGDRRSFEATGRVRLLIGNAGGLEIQWNGKPVGPVGRSGEVRSLEFTREGFRIQQAGM